MNRLEILSNRNRFVIPKGTFFLMKDSWSDFRKERQILERNKKSGIYEKGYWVNTKEIIVDIEIGKDRIGRKDIEDSELVEKYVEK